MSPSTDHLPDLVADRCVGCLACVSLCPDGAIHAIALPLIDLEGRIDAWAEDADRPRVAAESARARFVHATRFADPPARHGALPAALGLFIDPARCKACGACVAACASLGHGALVRIDKVADEGAGEPTLDRYLRDLAFLRSLPPTPPAHRHDQVSTDLVLAEPPVTGEAGTASCPGCGAATILRMLGIAARGGEPGRHAGAACAFRCGMVEDWTGGIGRGATVATVASLREALDAADRDTGWVVAGDEALDPDGVELLERMAVDGRRPRVLVIDRRSPLDGGTDRLVRRLLGRADLFVALTTPAHQAHAYHALRDAQTFPGPAVVVAYAPCQPEHGIAEDALWRQAHLAVQSRAFPLATSDPRRGPTPQQRVSLAGNPAPGDDWSRLPEGTPVDHVAFARTEARERAHVNKDGSPSLELQAIEAERLASWRFLQELAGVP